MTDDMEGMEPGDQYGLLERDYGAEPVGTVCAAFDPGMYIPRQDWPDLIQKHIQRNTRPIDAHTYNHNERLSYNLRHLEVTEVYLKSVWIIIRSG